MRRYSLRDSIKRRVQAPNAIYPAALLLTIALVFSASLAKSRFSGVPNDGYPNPQNAAATGSQKAKEKIPAESITLTRHGFEPREISRAGGRFFLSVENRSGVNPLVLRVTTQTAGTLKEFTLTRDQLDWADEVNLPAGQYTVTEVNHGWSCRLTITTGP